MLRLPEMSPHTVVLWLDDETKPAPKPRWVMMIAEDESPLIVAAEPKDATPWFVKRLQNRIWGLLFGLAGVLASVWLARRIAAKLVR